MIWPMTILLGCQLAGELASRLLSLPLPGPVLGMILFLALLFAFPRLSSYMAGTVRTLLGLLSLLFVPAGVGVVEHLDKLAENGIALLAALIGSTILALAAGVLTFRAVARLLGRRA